jgi:transposase InsO family protein
MLGSLFCCYPWRQISFCSVRHVITQPIENLQTDNGGEFAREFERATAKLGIQRYFSRVKTAKDNPEIERFGETLEYEWDCGDRMT